MRKFGLLSVALALMTFVPDVAEAQRRVTGRVTAVGTSEPLEAANVMVVGTALAAYTNEEGRFAMQAPEGPIQLLVRRIGYKRQTVTLPAGQNEVDVALERDVLQLESQVVTGAATTIARQNAANDVATVQAEELNRAPAQTVESALQGKVPGATISANSGAPGGGMQVQLRGVTSIFASADPLFVVDGVIVSNAAIASGTNAVTRAAAGGNASNQDNPVNRIADLNPNDIERIEILKGASASAIYGARASNGVIMITTRQGSQGAPQFNLTQRFGTFDLSNQVPTRRWTYEQAAASPTWGDLVTSNPDLYRRNIANGGFNHQQELFGENALSWSTSMSVRGGSPSTRYYVSGLTMRDEGVMAGTGYGKQSLRVNLTQLFGSRVTMGVSTNLVHSLAQRGLSNNDNAFVSPYMVLSSIPTFYDLRKGANGLYPLGPIFSNNPLQTRDLMRNDENVYRFLGSSNVKFNAIANERQSLVFSMDGGADFFNQRNELLFPPELFWEPDDGEPGTSALGSHSNLNYNVGFNGTHTWFPASQRYTATTSFGATRARRGFVTSGITTTTLLAGQANVDQGANVSAVMDKNIVRDFALYAQEELLTMGERLLLTAGIRAERSSANGDENKFYYFPKGAVSFRLPSFAFAPQVDEFKLRLAVGQSGNQPFYGQRYTRDTTGNVRGQLFVYTGSVKGNTGIKPEIQTEIETGFDATMFGQRASLTMTLYQKTIDDLILSRTPAPSTGFAIENFNAGAQLRNRGLEISLGATPWQTNNATWISRVTYARNYSVVTKLPIPAFEVGGFGTSLGAFKIEQGRSATQIVGNKDGAVRAIGDAAPAFQMAFSNTLQWGNFQFSGLVDWRSGGNIINLTRFLYDIFENSADYGDANSPGYLRNANFSSNTSLLLEDAGFVKLRELSIAYTIPAPIASRIFRGVTRSTRLELSGRNLMTWTKYSGLDPEVSNFGNQQIVRNIDVAPYPPSRSIFFTIDLGF